MLNNFQPGYVFRHPVFLVTFIIAIPAWIIAFAAQCAAEAQYSTTTREPVVNYLWFAIWIQLAIIIHLFLALATDQLAIHRFQLAIVGAIAVVFAVYGANFIFSDRGALIATGVGWLLLAMVDLIWVLYLTSEEGTPFYQIFTAGGTGGLSNHSTTNPRRHSNAGFSGAETGSGVGGGYSATPRMNGGGYAMGGTMGGYAPADTTPQKMTPVRDDFSSQSPGDLEDRYKQKAKAMYAYSASPDDPNEVSFAKGDILDVVDNTGKWFQVRTPTGQTGIAPSNYLSML